VDDIGRGAEQLGKGHEVMDALRLDKRWAALVVLLRAEQPGRDELLLTLRDECSFSQCAATMTPSSFASLSA
jgi:hypothetical protein